ncbi:MAG TPA: peptidoglycan-binding domain-containing protein [bacterium]|nr:peptidoglycan-binding domain-containing protein [bacterium]HPL95769.1 peptidoglycan-binding domain-containing protein [bacterium]
MSKIIFSLIFLLFLPLGFVRASNDVTISEDTNITLTNPSMTLVLKTNSTFNSMTVTESTIAFTISAGGTITLHSPDKYILNNDLSGSVLNTCDATGSWITYSVPSGGSDTTITFTPGTALCDGGSTSSTGGGGGGSSGPAVTNAQPAIGTQSVAKTIGGESGGLICTTDKRACLAIPAGLLSGNTSLNIVPKTSSGHGVPVTNYSAIASQVYDFTITNGDTIVTTFTKKVTLTFGYTSADISGIDENSLKIYYWDEINNKWVEVDGILNTNLKTVIVEVDHFTIFGLFGKKTTTSVTPVPVTSGQWSPPAGYEYISGPSQLKNYRNIITEPGTHRKYGLRIGGASVPVISGVWSAPAGYEYISGPSQLKNYRNIITEPGTHRKYGLRIGGALTNTTATISGAFNQDLSYGMINAEVRRMQEFLISKGYLATGLNTGNFYSMTKEAVKKFQKDHQITPVNGLFGPQTRAAANAEL